ncbi:MAG: TIGR03759 family integrating conjugative element protein [Gammaproteobacteria bacterium]|nr:TIGR03759 family integrating conjugative element protein [Gammaproteobacteria bacterium]
MSVAIFCGLLSAHLIYAQNDVNVVVTEIERRTSNQLGRDDTELLDESHWQLDSKELERVEVLREGFRRYISDRQISPLEILGIHARTDAERRRYARRWAAMMVEDAERVLAFQRAYDAAVSELLADQPLIDLAHLPVRVDSTPSFLPTDRLAVFVELGCEICEEILKRALRVGSRIAGVDVYVLGLEKDDKPALHAWANRQGIPPMAVHAKRITLNFDEGLLERVHPRAVDLPVVMRRRGDRLDPIDPWELP